MPQRQTPSNGAQKKAPLIGVLEWFRPGEHERVEAVLQDLKTLGIRELRTGFSWADWHTDGGEAWYDWLMPRLAREVNVLPCFTYTPPSLGLEPKTASPPRDPDDYVRFVDAMAGRYGACFDYVELWNEPNNLNDWDWHLDHGWEIFSYMVREAATHVRERGKKAILAGMCPPDPNWLDMLGARGVLNVMDAVGVHAFPGTWTFDWTSWTDCVGSVREILARHDASAEVWITEAGYSTWQHDEYRQLVEFVKAAQAPAERLYWYSAHDLPPDLPHQDGFHEDERHYHLGLRRAGGPPKLLFRIWAEEGLEGVREMARIEKRPSTLPQNGPDPLSSNHQEGFILITGGAGFVGTNLADRLCQDGHRVCIYDSLTRPGSERNLRWLLERHGDLLKVDFSDVRNPYALQDVVRKARQVFHLAAQVAVTTSLERPAEDFAVNVQGTVNLLEALRSCPTPPPLVFTSTNKVYGPLSEAALEAGASRYHPPPASPLAGSVDESAPLHLESPYGCSKGAADQYVLDYAHQYGIPAVVFRPSCIYGLHQHGTEDQGWVAHFLRCALEKKPLTLYGTGKQVRDVLFAEDLVEALLEAQKHREKLTGQAFNIGGGPENTVSLLEMLELIDELHGQPPAFDHAEARPGDQKYYVSNIGRFQAATGWAPSVDVQTGVERLYRWLSAQAPANAAHQPLALDS